MGLRADILPQQLKPRTADTVLSWNDSQVPVDLGMFTPATSLADGQYGLVPKPLMGQQTFILSNNGWITPPSAGGAGTVGGSGAANRLSFWTNGTDITSDATLTFDATNKILKGSTINLSRAGLPGAGITDGDFLYDSTVGIRDFRARVNGNWIDVFRAYENTRGSGETSYDITESDLNKYVITTSASPVTIRLLNLSARFGCTIVKGGAGDVTISVIGGPALVATATTITTLNGAAHIFHSDTTTNTWRAYGNLG